MNLLDTSADRVHASVIQRAQMEAESLAAFARKNGLALKVDVEPQRDQVIVVRDAALPTPAPTMVDERGKDILQFAPQFSGVSSPEPTLERIIWRYYLGHIDDEEKALAFAAAYVDALRTALATRPTLQSLGGDAGVSEVSLKIRLAAAQLEDAAEFYGIHGFAYAATKCTERAADLRMLRSLTSTEKSDGSISQAARDVLAERQRQISAEGWTPEHDDEHSDGSLASAAACYALHTEPVGNVGDYLRFWPWAASWWKPKDRRSNLIRSAALTIAEIERIDRAAPKAAEKSGRSES